MYQIDKIKFLQIGVQGENDATNIEIDMASWVNQFPDAVFHILFKPYNASAPSPMLTTYADGVLTWTVGVGATAVVGVGYTEVRAQDASTGLIKKSRIIPTSVDNSVSGVEITPPASYQEWVTDVLNAGTDAKNSAAAAMAYSQGKQIKFEIGDDEDPDGMAGHLLFYFKDEEDEEWEDYLDLGPVDVYATAVAAGYTGTKAQWIQSIEDAEANAQKSEKYAVGKVNGTDVGSDDPTYHNNSKYYSEQAAAAKTAAEAAQAAAETAAQTDLVAWLEQNITNPDSPPLDRTLSSSSAATPADITGDLKSAIIKELEGNYVKNQIALTGWEQGRYSSSSGSKTNANNGCRIPSLVKGSTISYKGVSYFKVTTGYELLIIEYSSNSTSSKVAVPVVYQDGVGEFWLFTNDEYYYSFSIRKSNEGDFTPSDLPTNVAVCWVYSPDDSLTQAHKAADAKVVGDKIDGIIDDIYELVNLGVTSSDWEKGFISSSTGTNTNSGTSYNISIRTANKIPLKKDDLIYYNSTLYKLQVYQYDIEGQSGYVGYTKHFDTATNPYPIPADGNYRFVYRKSNESAISENEISTIASTFYAKRYEVSFPDLQSKASFEPLITPEMFYKIAIIGDSFAAGISEETGTNYTYSWLSMMSRKYGCTCEHYAEGGLTTRTWLTSDYGKAKLVADTNVYNLYFIALGINDSNPDSRNVPVGEIADMDVVEDHPDTFYGNMGEIYRAIKSKNANAAVCFITPMRIGDRYTPYQNAVVAMREKYGCLLVDSRDIEIFKEFWWSSNLKSAHPTAPMYSTISNAVAEKLSDDIYEHMTYLRNFPASVS